MPAGRAGARGATRGRPRGAALLTAAAACLVLAPGLGWASGRHASALPRARAVVVARPAGGKPTEAVKKRPLTDLELGEALEGKVVRKTNEGVLLDFGCEKYGTVTNPRKEALEKLEARQTVSATVELVDSKAGVLWVSVDGLSKGKRCKDMKEGDEIDGTIVVREKSRVKVDIGCEMNAILPDSEKTKDVFKLEIGEEVKGLRVESVDGESNKITLSFPGLSDLVADRAEPSRAGPKPRKADPKVETSSDGFRLMSLNANDLRKVSLRGVQLELSGGLAFDSIDKGTQTLTLKRTKTLDFFEGFVEGQKVKGIIKNKIRNAVVYADIGAGKNAKIIASPDRFLLKWGEEIDLVVERVDHEKGICDVTTPGLAETIAGRAAKLTELKDLEVGSIVSGRIEGRVGRYDREVWVDIGTSKSARVFVSDRSLAKQIVIGAEIQVMLDEVDLIKSVVSGKLHVE